MGKSRNWYRFFRKDDEQLGYRVERKVVDAETRCQHVEIFDTTTFGEVLFLDGSPQSSSVDEFIYHEAIVHPALANIDAPKRVFIAGGGEGATLREVLRYPSVRECVMVDFDREMVELAKRHMHAFHRGAFDDARVSLVHDDARTVLSSMEESFDAIIVDVTAPKAGDPASSLYTREFYELASSRLTHRGVLSTQAQSVSVNNLSAFKAINTTLRTVFPTVLPFSAYLPLDGDMWGFVLAFKAAVPAPIKWTPRLSEFASQLRLYDAETHRAMFALPKYVRAALAEPVDISTDEQPFVYPLLA